MAWAAPGAGRTPIGVHESLHGARSAIPRPMRVLPLAVAAAILVALVPLVEARSVIVPYTWTGGLTNDCGKAHGSVCMAIRLNEGNLTLRVFAEDSVAPEVRFNATFFGAGTRLAGSESVCGFGTFDIPAGSTLVVLQLLPPTPADVALDGCGVPTRGKFIAFV